jgi:hypothetical protein
MGTWGTAVFSDDLALDVREDYLRLLREGTTDSGVLKQLKATWAEEIADADDGPVFWLALAATQWEYGRLNTTVKSKALKVIESGRDDHRWVGTRLINRRKAVLHRLKAKLESPQPPRRTPRRSVTDRSDDKISLSPDKKAEATAWSIEKGADGTPFTNVCVTIRQEGDEGGGGVFFLYCDPKAIRFRWRGDDCLEIGYPRTARVDQKENRVSFYGKHVQIKYSSY